MSKIKVTPLGAGQDVGRSCILLTIGGKNVMLDCGMHMGYNDDCPMAPHFSCSSLQRRFPDFSFINQGNLNLHLSCVIISHFHLDHCGALPYMTEMVGYNGPIYMTMPTKAICPILLEDYRRITVDKKGETNFFTSNMVKDCMKKVTTVGLHETVQVDDELEIKAYYAGHVLGAAMFRIKVGSQSVVYTGDFNTTPDRHLGAAWIDKCRPDLLITESTYATTIRDSKRCRERDFLTKVHDCVEKGGKVLIPVFALGRAQEMCILLETYWERMNLKIPIYFAVGLTEKATTFYKMFITWTNQKIKQTFVHRNMFDFKHIKPFDRAYVDNPGPMVVFATPGMLHSGLSVQIFRKWAPNENNMLIMPGYCVAGTVGHKVISGAKKIEFENRQIVEVKMSVQYMSFSAHADAKGIMQLIQHCEPSKVLLVHGEASKMEFLKKKITQELGKECFMPANGETVSFSTPVSIPVDVSLNLVKKQLFDKPSTSGGVKRKNILHGMIVMNNNEITSWFKPWLKPLRSKHANPSLRLKNSQNPFKVIPNILLPFKFHKKIRLMEPDEAMSELGLVPHEIRFTSTIRIDDPSGAPASRLTDVIYAKLKSLLETQNVQLAPDCSIGVSSVHIKVDVCEDDSKSICVSWGYQDEELGKQLLPLIKDWAMETK